MAKENLNDLIDWLKLNERNRFEIYDYDRSTSIEKCASYNDLAHNYSSPLGYFEALADKGVKAVQIVKKIKNGSTYVREGCGLNFGLSTDTNNNVVAASGLPDSPAATQQHYPRPAMTGLGSPMMGLGFPEIMTMRSQSDRYEETRRELNETKAKLERAEEKNRDLETKCLTYQLGNEGKPSSVDKLIEGIAANPAALSQIIQSFKGGAPGLNSPAPALESRKISDTKSMVVDIISNNAQLTDDHVSASYYILMESLKGNEKFLDEYLKLLIKHKIIDGSNDNSNGF